MINDKLRDKYLIAFNTVYMKTKTYVLTAHSTKNENEATRHQMITYKTMT